MPLGKVFFVHFIVVIIFADIVFLSSTLTGALEVPLGSKLTTSGNSYWTSPSGDFAFGFFNRISRPDQFVVGISYTLESISGHAPTLVWTAGDVTVGSGSSLQLTMAGDLVVFDASKEEYVWSSNTTEFSVNEAALQDDGSLVLLDQHHHSIVWQSFHTPSNVILPGQSLAPHQMLRAAPSKESVASYYSMSIDSFGQLNLHWESNVSYWSSEMPSPAPPFTVAFSSDGALQVLNNKSEAVWSRFSDDFNDLSIRFRFLRLDVDGNLRMYSWDDSLRVWQRTWQAVENQCEVFGTCGLNRICSLTGPSGDASCACPFPSASALDCLAPYGACDTTPGLISFKHTILYGLYPPHDSIIFGSLEQCRKACLVDPLCTAVTVMNNGSGWCTVKRTRYVTGYRHTSLVAVSFVKICLDPLAVLPRNSSSEAPPTQSSPHPQPRQFCKSCLIATASGTFAAFFIIQIGIMLCFIRYRRRSMAQPQLCGGKLAFINPNSKGLLIGLSYAEIKDLTKNFKHPLGPTVFRAVLPGNKLAIVKMLNCSNQERQFRSAVAVLGSIHHKNLIRLEAYCCESDHRYFVYEFAKNGSVASWLFSERRGRKLTWERRVKIWIGVARAMAYLHSGCRQFIGHGRLKLENVVLDEEMRTKVTEFGLQWAESGNPEVAAVDDVHQFGTMLIEMVSGRRGGKELHRWAYETMVSEGVMGVVDGRLEGNADPGEAQRALWVALWCVQEGAFLRPSMGEVAKVLEGALTVDAPPPPFSPIPTRPKWPDIDDETDVD